MNEKKSTETKLSVEAPLRIFAETGPMEQRIRGLKALMKGGAIHSLLADPRFTKGVEDVVRETRSAADPKQRLLALTVLARIASRIKAKRDELGREMAAALQTPLRSTSHCHDSSGGTRTQLRSSINSSTSAAFAVRSPPTSAGR